ncbi:molybdopterin-synthase adenylyltransferase MoeB [Maribrevibacterium harenarium]|uniref:Molybdopterin-synthase adenylyltransferase MoeB n=1 Tax=Maribrevibacterium harenarium TaxID=2589817 RepID=A0A501WDQ9_9GAMM|nr:molybdopterin-synthase adenylyltransferase MoeB [Maribrevibacterium harenarium]
MNEQELMRYSRQLLLPEFDVSGQLALKDAHVVVVGVGGLGNVAALFLASAGVGKLTLIDHDTIESSNLPRQVLYQNSNVGDLKVVAAKANLMARNTSLVVDALVKPLEQCPLEDLLATADVVLECTDNFTSRQLLHRACAVAKSPLVSAAAIRWEGQLVTFRYDQQSSPCYECLYPDLSDQALSCNTNGILGPVVGMLGTFQALEAIKLLSGAGEVKHGQLKLFDGLTATWREMRLTKDPSCRFCSAKNS